MIFVIFLLKILIVGTASLKNIHTCKIYSYMLNDIARTLYSKGAALFIVAST